MTAGITGEETMPARNGGTELVDYSLKESNRKLILERRKVALLADRNGNYSSLTNDVINITIAPGANDEWLDGRSSYITANVQVTGSGTLGAVYLPNGPAACFQQVQIISASGQQLVNIMDYHSIQQLFSEWTTCRTWKEGAGQMYGAGDWEKGDWDPARYTPSTAGSPPTYFIKGGVANPLTYQPMTTGIPRCTYINAAGTVTGGAEQIEQQSCGAALALQQNLSSTGITVAFRLDLAWLFGNATLIPAQFFPLTLRATLVSPTTSLSIIGVESGFDSSGGGWAATGPTGGGPKSVDHANTTGNGFGPLAGITVAATQPSALDLQFSKVKFMASLVKVAPTFKGLVESKMSGGTFSMTVTNYFTAMNTTGAAQNVNVNINTTFSAHDCQAYYVKFVPQLFENTIQGNFGYNWGGGYSSGSTPNVSSSQLLLNGRYWPPQPNTTNIDHFHDTLDAFNISSENVAFSPVSYNAYNGRDFIIGFLLDRDAGSSLTGVSSVSSPVWTYQAYIPAAPNCLLNVHTCIAYTQILEVQKDGQIKLFQ